MASISHDKQTGRRTVQVVIGSKRHSIRLGKVPAKQAESARLFIEDLLASRAGGGSPRLATAEWVAGLPDTIRRRVERAGLIGPRERRQCPTLAEWLESYVRGRRDVKAATMLVYGHTRRNLLAFFGEDRRLDDVTPGDADAFRVYLATDQNLAPNTVARRMGYAVQYFRAAVRRKILADNPFAGQSSTVRENRSRFHFVTPAEAQAVLDACPGPEWRLVFALARYGGLRCASEVTRLRWADVNWEKERFTVRSPKTEHCSDGGVRVVPIFPELRPHLEAAWDAAEVGEVYCCPQYANANQMYRKTMLEIVRRAGLTPWPKLFQNCRSTRETELAENFPVHVACAWLGNSPKIAQRHYLQLTESHFAEAVQKAVQFPVQYAAAEARTDSQAEKAGCRKPNVCGAMRKEAAPCRSTEPHLLGRGGLEPPTPAFSVPCSTS